MVFIVTGVGRMFSVIPLFLNIGSGLALLSLSTITTGKPFDSSQSLHMWLCSYKYELTPPPDHEKNKNKNNTDYILIYLLKKKTFYRDIKFKNVEDDGLNDR